MKLILLIVLILFITPVSGLEIIYSDENKYISSSVNSTQSAAWVVLKEITLNDTYSGSWIIEYEFLSIDERNVDTQLYLNTVPYGGIISTSNNFYTLSSVTFENINRKIGDKLILYGRTENAGDTLNVRNLKINYNISIYGLNPYNYIDVPFDRFNAQSVYWKNSEIIVLLLILITFTQLFQLGLSIINILSKGRK